jgi:hypothetical protein
VSGRCPKKQAMPLDLTTDEKAALAGLLREAIDD